MTRTPRLLLTSLLALLAVPAGASAATVSAADGKLTYTAASGEANHLTVSNASGLIRFDDTGVSAMTAGSGCTSKGAQRVDCSPIAVAGVTADLGDGNDWLSGQVLLPFGVYGGLGNDQIAIFAGNDVIDAGPGADSIDAGWGDDTIDGGDGADTISGGYGDDMVVYASRTAGVSVSLDDVANDGAAGEGDNVRPTIDDVVGGAGDDALTGDAGGNSLTGGAGADTLDGGGGADVLDGGAGTDSFSGGAGIDSLLARDGAAESLACGTEADVAEADQDDATDADCELVNRDEAPQVPALPVDPVVPPVEVPVLPPSPTGGTGSVIQPPVATISASPIAVSSSGVAPVRVKCPSEAFEGCAGAILMEALDVAGSRGGKLDVRSARRRKPKPKKKKTRLGGRRFKVAAGQGATVPVRLDRRAWRKFKNRKRVKVQITVTMENAAGTTTTTQTVDLKPPPARRR
ncbi:MAG TPA: calcium-binding protein [Thermoleophilaceae bacterium]|jgi:hypothetical protein